MKTSKKLILLTSLTVLLLSPNMKTFALEISTESDFLSPDYGKTISMDFQDAQLNLVLKMFSQQSGLNFIASTEIASQTVNVYMENVPVEVALERILSANSLTYEINQGSNVFIVRKLEVVEKELMTRVYPLKHATVKSSKLLKTLQFDSEDEDSEDEDDIGIYGAIRAILTSDGSLVEDVRTNSLIVTDIPIQFPMIEQTIARLDVKIPQVLIEVEMLDVNKDIADKVGVKWGDTPLVFAGAQKEIVFPFSKNAIDDAAVKAGSIKDEDFIKLFEDGQFSSGSLNFSGLGFTINFLRTHTDTRNLARPRILTLNNETAEIEIVTDEAIGVTTTASSTGADDADVTTEAERTETGVFLRVTPQANVITREITMALEPRVVQARAGNVSGTTFRDPEQRGSKSILRVKDGDTIVLGGLLRTDTTSVTSHVPFIGKIPVLGAPFRHNQLDEEQRELIIFITPYIIDDNYASLIWAIS